MGIIKRKSASNALRASGVADALFSKVQQRVLAVLFGNHSRSFYANELIALAGSGSGAVQRELAQLEAAGLVTVKRVGNQKQYQANASAPIFEELRGFVLKTSGLVDVLRSALAPLAAQIDAALVFGSVAKGLDTAKSDIDLLVIDETLSYAELFAALEPASTRLKRSVNPTLYSRLEIDKRIREIWQAGKFLHQYGARRLSLTTSHMTQCIEAVQTAIAEAAPRVRELADAYPEFRDIGKRMLSEWEQGALDITPSVTAKSRAGDTLRHSVGLSDATKPREAKKAVYRNPDGPFSHKSR